jgi:hypothetical protein
VLTRTLPPLKSAESLSVSVAAVPPSRVIGAAPTV